MSKIISFTDINGMQHTMAIDPDTSITIEDNYRDELQVIKYKDGNLSEFGRTVGSEAVEMSKFARNSGRISTEIVPQKVTRQPNLSECTAMNWREALYTTLAKDD